MNKNSMTFPLSRHSIVLDIDETLIHAVEDMSPFHKLGFLTNPQLFDLRYRVFLLNLDTTPRRYLSPPSIWGITRPGLNDFLSFVDAYFQYVFVWSAGKYDYVHRACEQIFKYHRKPDAILTWDDCQKHNNSYSKPLVDIVNNVPGMNLDNMLILDDRVENFRYNPYNGILIPAYRPQLTAESIIQPDNALNKFTNWLLRPEVMYSTNLQTVFKNDIFN